MHNRFSKTAKMRQRLTARIAATPRFANEQVVSANPRTFDFPAATSVGESRQNRFQRNRWWFVVCVIATSSALIWSTWSLASNTDGKHSASVVPARNPGVKPWKTRHDVSLKQQVAAYVGAVQRARLANYLQAVHDNQVAQYVAALASAEQEKRAAAARATSQSRHSSSGGPTGSRSGRSIDDTLACIRRHESDTAGGYHAVNPSSQAGGAYQALPSTWDGYAGFARAEDAPPAIQDQWAREAIAAAGTRPWAGSGC